MVWPPDILLPLLILVLSVFSIMMWGPQSFYTPFFPLSLLIEAFSRFTFKLIIKCNRSALIAILLSASGCFCCSSLFLSSLALFPCDLMTFFSVMFVFLSLFFVYLLLVFGLWLPWGFIYLFIYLLFILAVLGLRFCARAFSSCGKRGPLFIAARGPLTVAASCCGAPAPDAQAQ